MAEQNYKLIDLLYEDLKNGPGLHILKGDLFLQVWYISVKSAFRNKLHGEPTELDLTRDHLIIYDRGDHIDVHRVDSAARSIPEGPFVTLSATDPNTMGELLKIIRWM